MAGPQFFTPPRVTPSKPARRFTLEQANKTLPLVKRIVADLVKMHKNATQLQASIESMTPGREQTAAQRELDAATDRLQGLVDELTDVGCEIKDYQTGLIDFVSRHQDRDIYLCWRLGEDHIGYWHEMQSGVAGRQPVAVLEKDA